MNTDPTRRSSTLYGIRVRGWLREDWSEWFAGATLHYEKDAGGDAVTELTVRLVDQSALLGLLARLHALNLALVSVVQLNRGQQPSTRKE